jgi:hypothetical protein
MNDRRSTLSDLLLLSGIDLLLASLCVSVGILVLFLSSDASGSNKQALSARPYERWWTLVTTSSSPTHYDLVCTASAVKPADFHDENQAVYFGNEWGNGICTLTVDGQANVSVALYSNNDCWSLLGEGSDKTTCNGVSHDNQLPVVTRVLSASTLPAPIPRSDR